MNRITKHTVYNSDGKYVIIIDVEYKPAAEPEVTNIEFEPALLADDVTYDCDVTIPVGSTIASTQVILYYIAHCHIAGDSLRSLIDKEI